MIKGRVYVFTIFILFCFTVSLFATSTPPPKPATPAISGIQSGFYNSNQAFYVSGNEATVEYSLNNGSTWQSYSGAVTLEAEGSYAVTARQADSSGNWSDNAAIVNIDIDKTAPSAPSITGISSGSYSSSQAFSVSGENGSTVQYSLNSGSSWQTYTNTVTLSSDGNYGITARQTDQAGNISGNASVISVAIDTSEPEIDLVQGSSYASGSQYDFGSVIEGSAGVAIPFSIINNGNDVLKVSGINLSDSNNFSLSASGFYTIPAGGTAAFTLTFSPSQAGNITAVLSIISNDSDESTYVLNLQGTGTINDTTPPDAPSVSGMSPSSDPRPTWTWTAPAGAVEYRYSFNGAGYWTLTTDNSYQPSDALANGDYTLYVQARDAAGNWSASGSGTIAVNYSGPGNFQVASHYYDKGTFNRNYSNYENAFSDNYSDDDVEIHSYIVIDFSDSIDGSTVIPQNITVKRREISDNAENNYNEIAGTFELLSSTRAVFKPDVEFYADPGGTFDWNNPNWNGLKPNYEYSVALSSSIKDTSGNSLNNDNGQGTWSFRTIDLDYGLYWFKDSGHAMKYVPGRDMPLEYYDPAKPTFIYSHGWEKTSVNYQGGELRDYRREGFFHNPGSYYPAQGEVDLVEIWKNPSLNHESKSWNFGVVYWNQLADDDYSYLSKPQKAEAKIWSTNGKGGMEYAIREFTGSGWDSGNTLVTVNAPIKPMSVIFAEIIITALQDSSNGNLRFMGHSLGNQMVTGISYILKEEYRAGNISVNLFPKRVALVDPYFRPGRLENSWTSNHPAAVNLGDGSDSPGEMCVKIMEDIISYADSNDISFCLSYYDVSGTSDKDVFWGNRLGDTNIAERDIAAILYLQSSWLPGSELDNDYLAHRHVNGRLWYLWQYAYAPPATGFSASSSDADIKSLMNYYKSAKTRFSIINGISTPTPADDTYSEYSGSWQK